MQIVHTQKVERTLGRASTVKADIMPQYYEAVQRVLRDNASLGENWQRQVGKILYNYQGKNTEEDILGSHPYGQVFMNQFLGIPVIGGEELLDLYKQAGNKNPIGSIYTDFGLQISGRPETNNAQAEALLASFKKHGIKLGEGRVPNLAHLRLNADQNAGLLFTLNEGVTDDKVRSISDYPFISVGKNGLLRAYLGRYGSWFANGDLANSNDDGRVVRYDAEGVAVPRIEKSTSDLVTIVGEEFRKKFKF
jgi:hypothetical protein